jgi:hypothetical protein
LKGCKSVGVEQKAGTKDERRTRKLRAEDGDEDDEEVEEKRYEQKSSTGSFRLRWGDCSGEYRFERRTELGKSKIERRIFERYRRRPRSTIAKFTAFLNSTISLLRQQGE